MKLALMGHKLRAPSAAGVKTVAGLNAGGDVAFRYTLTVGIVPVPAGAAQVLEAAH
jgi:hypothetical protein